MKKNNEGLKKPFFAEFLENQIENDNANSVQGGITNPQVDIAQTMKYPSDQEDGPTTKITDMAHTMKYPSDGDDDINNL
jgi:hypothetical protein